MPAKPVNTDGPDFNWWRLALAGQKPPIHEGEPQAGFYRRKLVKGGPWVACAIRRERDVLICIVAGKQVAPDDQWTWLAASPISQEDYLHMVALAEHASRYTPSSALADPTVPVKNRSVPVLFPRKK